MKLSPARISELKKSRPHPLCILISSSDSPISGKSVTRSLQLFTRVHVRLEMVRFSSSLLYEAKLNLTCSQVYMPPPKTLTMFTQVRIIVRVVKRSSRPQ